jgi:hypothetical protein
VSQSRRRFQERIGEILEIDAAKLKLAGSGNQSEELFRSGG